MPKGWARHYVKTEECTSPPFWRDLHRPYVFTFYLPSHLLPKIRNLLSIKKLVITIAINHQYITSFYVWVELVESNGLRATKFDNKYRNCWLTGHIAWNRIRIFINNYSWFALHWTYSHILFALIVFYVPAFITARSSASIFLSFLELFSRNFFPKFTCGSAVW